MLAKLRHYLLLLWVFIGWVRLWELKAAVKVSHAMQDMARDELAQRIAEMDIA